jgi:Protein of unknown function (DUF4232)
MSAHVPALPLEADPLIAEAKQRARRRRLIAVAALLAVGGAVAGGVFAFGAGGSSGAVPWLPTKPGLGPAHPPLAPACRASQLRGKLGLQGGGFGALVGPLMVTNRGSAPCALVGTPKLSFSGATSKWTVRRGPEENAYDPLTPPPGSLRALAPGRWAASNLNWGNWCGRGSSPTKSRPGQLPRALVLTAPGGGKVALDRTPAFRGIGCASRNGSVLAASRFAPIVPQGPPSSALPLAARIVPAGQARRGAWVSYTVVLINRGAKPFSFGRSCPAYEEGFGLRPAAYILNCRSVGSMAPHAEVRLAMRIFVPRQARLNTLSWTLAPHSWGGGVLATSRQ